jgi:hypothetical protein
VTPAVSRLSAFFKDADSALGVFYPKHYIIATFPNLKATYAANRLLRNAGLSEDEVIAVPGPEALEFFKQFREHAGILGDLMYTLSRTLGTEADFVDSDIDHARHGAGFLAIYSLTDSESARVVELVRPLEPITMQWYLTGGIRSLI